MEQEKKKWRINYYSPAQVISDRQNIKEMTSAFFVMMMNIFTFYSALHNHIIHLI